MKEGTKLIILIMIFLVLWGILIWGTAVTYTKLSREQEFNHKQFFIDNCIQKGASRNYCKCMHKELDKEMTDREITATILRSIQTNYTPDEIKKTSENCVINLDK